MAKKKENKDNPLSDLQKLFGDRVYMGGDLPSARLDPIDTGSIVLNKALGVGGWARGRVHEVYGAEGTGKTALGLQMLANTSGITALIDAEKSYEVSDAIRYGVNMDSFLVLKPESAEDAMEMACTLAKTCEAVVYDSIAGIGTTDELEKGISEHTIGSKAGKMSVLMRRYPSITEKHGCTTFFVNQVRDNMSGYGSPVVTPGGHALRFAATTRTRIIKIEKFPNAANPEGHYIHFQIVKNKLGTPWIKGSIPFLYGHGISREMEVLEIGKKQGVISQKGAWLYFEGDTLAQGLSNARSLMMEDPSITEEILAKIDLDNIL